MSNPLSGAQFGDADFSLGNNPEVKMAVMQTLGGVDGRATHLSDGYNESMNYTPRPDEWAKHAKRLGYGNPN